MPIKVSNVQIGMDSLSSSKEPIVRYSSPVAKRVMRISKSTKMEITRLGILQMILRNLWSRLFAVAGDSYLW